MIIAYKDPVENQDKYKITDKFVIEFLFSQKFYGIDLKISNKTKSTINGKLRCV